ncbi:hypothetical protein SDC9_111596 [bioreactor metagenome]|uniref:Uncharacterized protein n=1 Tax=bioreactor metagenome TaxID=1076179 RepID=A0A645BHZ2_9ZZZZ
MLVLNMEDAPILARHENAPKIYHMFYRNAIPIVHIVISLMTNGILNSFVIENKIRI